MSKRILDLLSRHKILTFTTTTGCLTLGLFCQQFNGVIERTENRAEISSPCSLFFLRCIFGRTRSRLTGVLFDKEIPLSFREYLYGFIARLINMDLSEIRYPLISYKCFGQLFARTLSDNTRKIEDISETSLVSPCDAEILSFGDVTSDRLPQIKNSTYNINYFLGTKISNLENKMKYIVLYLHPNSYHHFHSPCDFKVNHRYHFSGEVLPVFKGFLSRFNDIFSVNERIILTGKWFQGDLHMGIVAAYNVGNIRLADDPSLRTNHLRTQLSYISGDADVKSYLGGINGYLNFARGQHIGEFRLGSTIVLVFQADDEFKWNIKLNQFVRVGQSIGSSGKITSPEKDIYAFYGRRD